MTCLHLDLGTLYLLPLTSVTLVIAMGSQYTPSLANVAYAFAMYRGVESWVPRTIAGVGKVGYTPFSSGLTWRSPKSSLCIGCVVPLNPIAVAVSATLHRSSLDVMFTNAVLIEVATA